MINITKLKIWPELQATGFEPIKYRAHGQIVAIGASLRKEYIDSITGKPFKADLITIEPHNTASNNRYHIHGRVKAPYTAEFYRYEHGRKITFYETVTRFNQFVTAREILKTIQLINS